MKIFIGSEHHFDDQPLEPYVMLLRQLREMRPHARRVLIRAKKVAEQGPTTNMKKEREETSDMGTSER